MNTVSLGIIIPVYNEADNIADTLNAIERKVIPVMLTAHALSVEDTMKSFKEGAASYIPKEEMANIAMYLNDVLDAREQGKHFWWRWLDRFASYYDKKFGPDCKGDDPEFWKKFGAWM